MTANPSPESTAPGLSSAHAAARLTQDGYNELAPPKRRGVLSMLIEIAAEPMFLLLLAAGAIYLLLGDAGEAAMLLGFVVAIMIATVFQELRTSRALEALRDLSSPRAMVIRDGQPLRIAGREVVRGDVLLLAEGDRVAADGELVECHDLVVDESMLTGESVPVQKYMGGADDARRVHAGTRVVQGGGRLVVSATGRHSALGQIGESLRQSSEPLSPLQAQFRALVGRFAWLGLAASAVLVLALVVSGKPLLQAVLAGITLAMSALPQEFPVIVAVFFALGAWRIAGQGVLTRRQEAIETLGAITVLCVDKTGTLTENRMRIARLWAEGDAADFVVEPVDSAITRSTPFGLSLSKPMALRQAQDERSVQEPASNAALPEQFHALVEYGILASEVAPFDPMEQAFHALGGAQLEGSEHLHADWRIHHEYSLSAELLAMAHVWHGASDGAQVVATKGAPEAVVELCHVSAERSAAILAAAERMATAGLRVLGVARAALASGAAMPALQHDIPFEFIGLVGLEDPVRAAVPAAIAQALGAGCKVVIITGDYPATAQAVARHIGLGDAAGKVHVIGGETLDRRSDAELVEHARANGVFARIKPEQKLRLVRVLREAGEIVAMTGDGVNDAPALQAAHIGVAMGKRGTDVAREAARLVLLDDDFGALVATLRQGRRIFDNLRKALSYTLAVHMPIVGMSLLPALLGQPLMLLPALIVFYELVIDPSCSLVFEAEPEEVDVMRRRPRDPAEPLFGGRRFVTALAQGVVVLAVTASLWGWSVAAGWPEDRARALVFTLMVGGNLALLSVNRGLDKAFWHGLSRANPIFWWVCAGAVAGMVLVTQLPLAAALFHLAPLGVDGWALVAAATVATLLLLELLRVALRLPIFRRAS